MRPIVAAIVILLASGCSTLVRPTKPDSPLMAIGAPVRDELRFDGEETILREPGMPVSPSRAWQREVQNYTATSLNTLLTTSEGAPNARTLVSFDMPSPAVIQIGTWKEIDMRLTTTLPDGTVVKSAAVVGHIDDPIEWVLLTGTSIGGTLLNVVVPIAILVYVLGGYNPVVGIVALGSLVGGILLSVAQSVGQYFVAANEENRWSNLFAGALTQHAADVRKALAGPRKPRPPRVEPKALAPTDPSEAPPPLLK